MYVGCTKDLLRRSWEHSVKCEKNKYMLEDFKKFGIENFSFEVLEECDESLIYEREQYYISILNPSYNKTIGGKGNYGHIHSEETKSILSKKSKIQWEMMSDEEKLKRVENNLTGPKVGHNVSEETRDKIRAKLTGRKVSDESIVKFKETMAKKKANGWKKDGSKSCKMVMCIETGLIWKSVKEAAIEIGVNPTQLSQHIHGKYNTCKKFHFKFVEGVETNSDECSCVGSMMSYDPKCATHGNV